MKRLGIHRPTIEDLVEISGIETLHPGGFALTRRTAELLDLQPGMHLLDVSSGRGTQAVFYAQNFGVTVVGVDLSADMIAAARTRAAAAGLDDRVTFRQGDSQALPFEDTHFDAVVNECAVGIPDDSQKVLDEMVRVVKPGGALAIHESLWRCPLPEDNKRELAERYGTTPLAAEEWEAMLARAGVEAIVTEIEPWSRPEMFWKIRAERDVSKPSQVLSLPERARTVGRVYRQYGLKGIFKALENEKRFYGAVIDGKIGYGLFKGVKRTD
ncbi:MAG: methyltransferase domain-containing protein [Desulfobacterales bacterium]|nr:methyltransferase domain-containing protein [Desulfobacterales bacterium]